MTSYLLSNSNDVELLFHINKNLHDIHNENIPLNVLQKLFQPFHL